MKDFLIQTIKEAGYIAKGYFREGIKIHEKSDADDLLTEGDLETSRFIVNKIKDTYPDHGINSEEEEKEINPDAEYMWVIDPIDGTRNFAKHISYWCVMIGITRNNEPYMSAIFDPNTDELYFAKKGKGAFLNGKRIHVSETDDIDNYFLSYGSGYNRPGSPYHSPKYEKYLKFLINTMGDNGHWVQNYGSMLTLCHLSAGRVDALVQNVGLYHDYLPPYLIATEAGAIWTNSEGFPWKRGERDIIVANPKLHPKILKMFD